MRKRSFKKAVLTLAAIVLVVMFFPAMVSSADVTIIRDQAFLNRNIFKTTAQTLAFGASDTTKSFTVDASAKIHSAVVVVPNFTNSVTATLTVANADSANIYTSSALSKGNTHFIQALSDYVALSGVNTFTVTLSGAPGGSGGNVTVSLYLE